LDFQRAQAPLKWSCIIDFKEAYRVTPDSSHSARNTTLRLLSGIDRLYLWSAAAGLIAAGILIEIARSMR